MIQKIEFKQVITSNIDIIGNLLPISTDQQKGLLSSEDHKIYPKYLSLLNKTYKIGPFRPWERFSVFFLYNSSTLSCLDLIGLLNNSPDNVSHLTGSVKHLANSSESIKYYVKEDEFFIQCNFESTQPNHAYILSPLGIEEVGTAEYIDDSFTEIK